VDNHIAKAILVTIFACLPIGLVSLVYASQVDRFLMSREYKRASDASQQADKWANYAIYAGVVSTVLSLIFFFILMHELSGSWATLRSLFIPPRIDSW